ncbi:coA-transferase III family protein [Mycobacterium xenopi 4042]|uniref:CoA-transferase III family protein n=1 Tax=Mycobacterium xenopi 4042 TaxID=1299334 RepID=X8CMI3_MYCXE|nr:coA-transferase III family protein [Mycobacterium xenopi 4042]
MLPTAMPTTSTTASGWPGDKHGKERLMARPGTGPLAGVRVVDLTAMVMGPYCTQIMADMGADVLKVEPPEGDVTRYVTVGPAPGMSGVFANVNRGKRSIVLDLRSDNGKSALRALIETADVFIHSMRAKAIGKLGFAYDEVAAINPAIVYTNCYGYGRRGPDRDLPAYDDTIQAECGLPAVQQMLTGEASYVGTIMADKVAGLTALYATMMALFHRERTGEGQEVEVAMFETMASFMLVEHANGAIFEPPLGPAGYPRALAPTAAPTRPATATFRR